MQQLFHRKAGIESHSPVVTLMRASVHAPEGHGSNGRGQPIPSSSGSGSGRDAWMDVCSVIVPGVVVERVRGYCILYTHCSQGLVHTYIRIYSAISTYAC